MTRKIIVVAFHLGRVGSSAVMGLLKISGINIGKDERLFAATPMNPKGFFELKSQQNLLKRVFKGIYPNISNPPSLELMDETGRNHYLEYDRLIQTEFGNRFPIALKSQRFLTLPFLWQLRKKYHIKTLVIERKLENQVNSTMRIWKKKGNPVQKKASIEFVSKYQQNWKLFAREVEKHYAFFYYHVQFEDLISSPFKTTSRIFKFIGEKCPSKHQINHWLDPSLVNREQ